MEFFDICVDSLSSTRKAVESSLTDRGNTSKMLYQKNDCISGKNDVKNNITAGLEQVSSHFIDSLHHTVVNSGLSLSKEERARQMRAVLPCVELMRQILDRVSTRGPRAIQGMTCGAMSILLEDLHDVLSSQGFQDIGWIRDCQESFKVFESNFSRLGPDFFTGF